MRNGVAVRHLLPAVQLAPQPSPLAVPHRLLPRTLQRQYTLPGLPRTSSRDEHAVLLPVLDAVEGRPRAHVLVESQPIPTRAHVPYAFNYRMLHVVPNLPTLGPHLGIHAFERFYRTVHSADVSDVCNDAILDV